MSFILPVGIPETAPTYDDRMGPGSPADREVVSAKIVGTSDDGGEEEPVRAPRYDSELLDGYWPGPPDLAA